MAYQNRGKQGQGKPKKCVFEDYWSPDRVHAGLASGELIQGVLRVNPKNFEESFVLHPSGDADVFLHGLPARNRTLNDDLVAVRIEPIKNWKLVSNDEPGDVGSVTVTPKQKQRKKQERQPLVGELCQQSPSAFAALFPGATSPANLESWMDPPGARDLFRTVTRTGRVVALLRPQHHRLAVGSVQLMAPKAENPQQRLLFCPTDRRIPRMVVDRGNYPPELYLRPDDFKASYLLCRLLDWPTNGVYAVGRIERLIGKAGDLKAEQEALLLSHGVPCGEFAPEVLAELPSSAMDESEIARRRDFRATCVFSIDPASARDLDDALHVRPLGPTAEYGYEVGVHIADVSHYIAPNGRLDVEARNRSTSVYLVDQVVPMLPRKLCEDLCSLNPGEDKLTFSVVWKMDSEGNILDTWFGRSVIRSCAKLSYEHAQGFINEPDRQEWPEEGMPHVFEPWRMPDIQRGVLQLWSLSRAMRERRFRSGALRLNSAKLAFVLDPQTGLPCGFVRENMKESNFLVEEMMVAANISVAIKLFSHLSEEAFLRRHPGPSRRALVEVRAVCLALGVPLDIRSAADIHRSLVAAEARLDGDTMEVLVNFLSKPMQLAQYFCAGQLARCDEETQLTFTHHYALNVDLYTHFTSPIRRYPDIIVHRQLAAVLAGLESSIVEPTQEQLAFVHSMSLDHMAAHCNLRKKNSKTAQEASRDLFLRALIAKLGQFSETGCVLGVLDRSFDVMLIQLGCIKRVYIDQIEGLLDAKFSAIATAKGAGSLTLRFAEGVQEVRPMSRVDLLLKKADVENEIKFDVLLIPKLKKARDVSESSAGEGSVIDVEGMMAELRTQ